MTPLKQNQSQCLPTALIGAWPPVAEEESRRVRSINPAPTETFFLTNLEGLKRTEKKIAFSCYDSIYMNALTAHLLKSSCWLLLDKSVYGNTDPPISRRGSRGPEMHRTPSRMQGKGFHEDTWVSKLFLIISLYNQKPQQDLNAPESQLPRVWMLPPFPMRGRKNHQGKRLRGVWGFGDRTGSNPPPRRWVLGVSCNLPAACSLYTCTVL